MIKTVTEVTKGLNGIFRMEPGGQLLPYSLPLLVVGLVVYASSEFELEYISHTPVAAAKFALIAPALLTILTAIGLFVAGRRERLKETLVALLLAGAVVTIVNVAMRVSMPLFFPPEIDLGKLIGFLLFPLFLWNLLVFAYIYQRAFAGRPRLSLGLSAGYLVPLTFVIASIWK
jgi:hypothetical protein